VTVKRLCESEQLSETADADSSILAISQSSQSAERMSMSLYHKIYYDWKAKTPAADSRCTGLTDDMK